MIGRVGTVDLAAAALANALIFLPFALAIGIDHSKFTVHKESVPLSNFYVSILRALDVPADKFADSTGNLDKHLFVS